MQSAHYTYRVPRLCIERTRRQWHLTIRAPIANNERPLGTLKTLGPIFSLCADSGGRIAAADANQFAYGLDVYDQPISLGASPSFSLATSALPLYCSFDPVGNLYVTTFFDGANYSDIDVFFAPVRPGTAVGKRIPLNYQDHTRGLTADRNGNVFISNDRGIVEYSSLSTGNNIVARFGNSENGNIIRMGPDGNLYVDEGHSFHVYDAPFHSGQSFTRAIAVPLCSSLDMFIDSFAFDSAGDMILSCGFSSGTLLELAPPYTGPPIGVTSMTFPAQDIVVAP